MVRLLVTVLAFHVFFCALLVLSGAGFVAVLLSLGIGYAVIGGAVAHVPLLLGPAGIAIAVWVWLFRQKAVTRPIGYSALIGCVPILIFLGSGEVVVHLAMRSALAQLGSEACLFGARTFTGSALEKLARVDLFEEDPTYRHHAHVALPDGTLLIWSYRQMDFVPFIPSEVNAQRVPGQCEP